MLAANIFCKFGVFFIIVYIIDVSWRLDVFETARVA
jgi:hypothetical protein